MIAQTTISKWGNSQGVRLPASIAEFLNSEFGDKLTFYTDGEKVIISVEKKEKNLYETEFVQNYDFDKDRADDPMLNFEYTPVGKEVVE